MNPLDLLQSCLLELLHELEETGIALTVGGGYGLILKSRQIAERESYITGNTAAIAFYK
jgi:hypothetical protein